MLTTQVTSYSVLTIQLLVVCLTLVQWPTTVMAKALTSRQKEKDSKKKKTSRQKEKDSKKKKTSRRKEKDSRQNFFDTERTF